MGIANPARVCDLEHSSSLKVTKPLCTSILEQSDTYSFETYEAQIVAKAETRQMKRQHYSSEASQLLNTLPSSLQYSMKLAQEKGASNWLTALPIEEFGLVLHKGAF